MEWREGDVTGLLPYSRLVGPPGDSIVQEPAAILVVHGDDLRAMIRECHAITSILVHTMIDRVRVFTSSDLHDEKMVSLGKLSAGLAHELNNPASAIERSAALLSDRLEDAERADARTRSSQVDRRPARRRRAIRDTCMSTPVHGVRSPIEQAEHEEAIADWLVDHGLDAAIAEMLADTSATFETLDRLANAVDRSGARRRAAMGGARVFGPRARVGDSGRGDAHLGTGHGDQGLHAHGPGDGCRAGGPDARPGQHRRRAQVEGADQGGRRGDRRRSRTFRACADSSANSTRSGRT